jgi:phospholipase/carboxylesterase
MALTARHYALIGGVAVVSAAGASAITRLATLPPTEMYEAAEPVAEALVESDAPVWPPQDFEPSGPPAPVRREDDIRAPPEPALPDLPPDTEDFRVRRGSEAGFLYLEHLIGAIEPEKPIPLVVVLHGRASRAHIVGEGFRTLPHPVRVVCPQANDVLDDGYQWLPVRVGSGLVERLASSLFQISSELAAFIRSMVAAYPTAGRAIVTGFSQGGLVTLALAIHHDDVVGHALPIAGWLPPPLEPTYRRSDLVYPAIRAMHGRSDQIVPLEDTRALFDRLASRRFDVELVEFEGVAHEVTGEMNALFRAWLEQAICRVVDDPTCIAAATERERALRRPAGPDAGMLDAGASDAGDAAVLDAAP